MPLKLTTHIRYICIAFLPALAGCDLEKIEDQVVTPPTASFTVDNANCTAPCTVKVSNTSQNASSYLWNFGDPSNPSTNTSSLQNPPDRVYANPGSYIITLIATGNAGKKDTAKTLVTVSNITLPTASFTIDNANCTAPCTVKVSNTSQNASSYLWNFGDPSNPSTNTSSLQNPPDRVYANPGSYIITLIATGNAGKKDTATALVNVDKILTFNTAIGTSNTLETAEDVIETLDGGYAIIGKKGSSIYFLKTDAQGNKLLEKTDGAGQDGQGIIQTADNGFAIIGINSPIMYFARLMSDGTIATSRFFNIGFSAGNAIIKTNNNGYLLVGNAQPIRTSMTPYDGYVIRVDGNGVPIWEKTFGSSNSSESLSDAIALSDGGFVLVGDILREGDAGNVYLLKLDGNGNKVWEKTFGENGAKLLDSGESLAATPDGGFILAGRTTSLGSGSGDVYLIKVDKDGNKVWESTIGDVGEDLAEDVVVLNDGSSVAVGYSELSAARGNVLLIKVDPNGNQVWKKSFPSRTGGPSGGKSIIVSRDGGFVISGYIYTQDLSDSDVLLIKTDANGEIK